MNNFFSMIFVSLALFLYILLWLSIEANGDLRQEAVDRGFAEWQLIEGSKETQFKWKE